MNSVYDAKLLGLPKIEDPRGNLSFIEQMNHIPFAIKRVYWIYDVPGGCDRGGHAYKQSKEFIVALSGSFDVVLNDGKHKQTVSLNRAFHGLYVPNGLWRTMTNFATNSLVLVLSSTDYDENDYIMNYEEFKRWRNDPSIETHSPNYLTSVKAHEMNGREISREVRNVFDCSPCELNKIHDPEGNLTYLYEEMHVPFPINRVFYIYDIPGGKDRGAHAHKTCHQFMIAASGSFEVVLNDGENERTVQLNRPYEGLHVPPGIWASEQGFSSGSICLVLTSHNYDEEDYIRDYNEFLNYAGKK